MYSYSSLLCDARFHNLLLAFDRDLAAAAREAGCELCGGALHSARYWRKPRGRACLVGPEHDRRFSFCCAVDSCRRRATPPSLRFLGRNLATVVVLVSMMQHGVTEPRVRRLAAVVGVDRRTVARWRVWWREVFTTSGFWQAARASFMPPVDDAGLPATLMARFAGDGEGGDAAEQGLQGIDRAEIERQMRATGQPGHLAEHAACVWGADLRLLGFADRVVESARSG